MKNCLLLSLLAALLMGCGKSSPPPEAGRPAEPAPPPTRTQPGPVEQVRAEADSIVSQAIETITETAQETVAEVREQAEAIVAETQEQVQTAVQEAQAQAQTVLAEVQDQAQTGVAQAQQQVQTVVTQLPAQLQEVPAQVLTQAQTQLQTLAGQTLDLRKLQPTVTNQATKPIPLVAGTDTNQSVTLPTNAVSAPATHAVSSLETNVVTNVTNVVQDAQKALDRLFAPRRIGSP